MRVAVVALVAVLAGICVLAHIAPFPFLLDFVSGNRSVWRKPSPAGDRTVYLTYDDGPNPDATPELLDLLRDKQVKATFFLIPNYINASTEPIVRRMAAEGHTVAVHSADRWLMLRTSPVVAERLRESAARIEAAGAKPCAMFRPHAGWRSLTLISGVRRAGFHLAGWSWMTWDWVWFRERKADRVASQITSHAAPGKIFVIHDGHHRNPRADRRYAIEASARIIDALRARGYAFGVLCP